MITWMQRHKKWLIITIWISTIAFVGAGFVGWGQYSYGDKAGAVAKVGDVEISMGEMQKEYSNLYAQYAQVFKGDFDKEKAKQFGLQKQAINQLIQQALLINLARSYSLEVSDKELVAELTKQKYFFNKDGVFDKEIYKQVLSQNRLSTKEYENSLRKTILIQKLFKLLPVDVSKNEKNIVNTLVNIADKISYDVLDIKVQTSDELLKPYWEQHKDQFLTDVSYTVVFIKQDKLTNTYDDAKIAKYYKENKTHFKAEDGKILPLEKAKDKVVDELNAKATKDKALRTYIAFKKDKLDKNIKVEEVTISKSNNKFNDETLDKISKLAVTSPYAKPILVDGVYYTFKLIKINQATPKTYADAKDEVKPLYVREAKENAINKLIAQPIKKVNGTVTPFITSKDADKLKLLTKDEAEEFLQKLFITNKKIAYLPLSNGKVVKYAILEQKLLTNDNTSEQTELITQIKSGMFNSGLMKTLQNKYHTEIFIQGL